MIFDIETLRRKVLARYPWFGSVAAGLEYEESETVRTTSGDGKTIYYNPAWLSELSMEAQIFALAHELCHVAFHHIRRSRGKDPVIWKKATDAVVNQLLKWDGLELPPYAIDDPEALDLDAEDYYGILLEQKLAMDLIEGTMQKPRGSGGGDRPEGEDGEGEKRSGGEDEDDHGMWEDAAEEEQQEEEDREEKLREELARIQEMMEDSGEQPDSGEDPDEGDKEDEEDEEQEKALVSQKVSQAGNSVDPDLRVIEDIGSAGPVIDWRMILRETVNHGVDWSMEHAILEDGIVRPILEECPMPETEIVLDTSWSVDDELLRNFLRECRHILHRSRLWAGCFDTVFYGFHEIRTDEDIESMPLEGGGGTDFDVATGAFSLRADNRIIFTDGEAPMPQEPLDCVWMVYGGEKIEPPGGRVIHITDEQMQRLGLRSREGSVTG